MYGDIFAASRHVILGCALGHLTELGRKHRICCLSHTQEGPWANKEILLHKSSTPKAPVRGGSGTEMLALVCPHQTRDKVGWGGEYQIQTYF